MQTHEDDQSQQAERIATDGQSAPESRSLFELVRDDPSAALATLLSSPERLRAAALLRDHEGSSLLMVAALCAESELVETLWRDSDLRARDDFGWTPLHHAAAGGSAECVITLLREAPAGQADAVSNGRATPLVLAAQKGHLDALRALLPHSDPQIADLHTEQGALGWAAASGSAECVALLLTDPRACRGDDALEAMQCAASGGKGAALRVLIEADPDLRSPSRAQQTVAARRLLVSLTAHWSDNDQARLEALDEALSSESLSLGARIVQGEAFEAFGEDALPRVADRLNASPAHSGSFRAKSSEEESC